MNDIMMTPEVPQAPVKKVALRTLSESTTTYSDGSSTHRINRFFSDVNGLAEAHELETKLEQELLGYSRTSIYVDSSYTNPGKLLLEVSFSKETPAPEVATVN